MKQQHLDVIKRMSPELQETALPLVQQLDEASTVDEVVVVVGQLLELLES